MRESAPKFEQEEEEDEREGGVDDEEVKNINLLMNKDYDNENYFDDFRGEDENWNSLYEFSRGI